MARIESRVVVSKSVDQTFAFLSKRESHLNFIPRMVSLTQTSPGEFSAVGAKADGILNYFGIKIPVQYEIAENISNQMLAMNGWMGPITFKDGYILNKQQSGTEIKFWLELTMTGITKLFQPFAGLIGRVHAWETLRNLKRELGG